MTAEGNETEGVESNICANVDDYYYFIILLLLLLYDSVIPSV